MGTSDSSTWPQLLIDRRGRPSSDASSPLVSVAPLLLASVAGLLLATWNAVFRLRAYLVLFLAGSRDLASSERCPGVYFRRHKQMFGGLRPAKRE